MPLTQPSTITQALLLPADNTLKISELRAWLKSKNSALKNDFEQGILAPALVLTRAQYVDELLQYIWQKLFGVGHADLALVAVGGYGRGTLHPASDVDILVLGTAPALETQRSAIETFLTLLWDIGLEVGHSVRTPEDCTRHGAADITVATSLMEARLLVGSATLFAQMQAVTTPERIWPSAAFFECKQQERQRRCQRYDQTACNLEPNIKEGPGGLRDVQMIVWVAQRHCGVKTLEELVSHGFLSPHEYHELIQYRDFLWQIRCALHFLTGRREDTLLFEHQQRIAAQFGYLDQEHSLAVEQFMQRYYRTVNGLSCLNEMLLQLLAEAILPNDEPSFPVIISQRFQARRGYLEARRNNVFTRHPYALLEVFLLLQQHPELHGIGAATIRLIRDHKHLIDEDFRNNTRAQHLFMAILCQPYRVTQQLRLMNTYGVLAAYLPEFAQISGRMQYDLFHAYTVDQHTLFVVRNLRRFGLAHYAAQFPECSAIMERLPQPELLYIAALYHDIGKGRGGDHSELGAQDVQRFGAAHGLSSFDRRLVAWLVRHHLALSLTAQKQDLDDPQVIHRFAALMGDQLHLDHLYLLTVADICATNPNLWNAWRGTLLWQLYQRTRCALRRGLEQAPHKEQRIAEVQTQALQRLRIARIPEGRSRYIWESFGDDYFLRHAPDQIAWHTRAILKHGYKERPLVMARNCRERGGTEVFIYTRNQDNLFALITSLLDHLGLTVLDARIITGHGGYTLDSFTVLERSGAALNERSRIKEITSRLTQTLAQPNARPFAPSRYISRAHKAFRMLTKVAFHEDRDNRRTVVELLTWDQPGLLCRVGQAFIECGVQLHNAKIATVGACAEDVFFVTDLDNHPLDDAQKYLVLRDALIAHLDVGATGAY